MFGFGQLIDILKKSPKKIVFTEGNDPRILEAASRLLAGTFLHPILVGDPAEIVAVAEESGYNIRGAEIINPLDYDRFGEMVTMFCELRKSKGVTPEEGKEGSCAGKLFWNDAGKNGSGRCPAWRSDLFDCRYGASGITAYQDKAGQFHCILLLYSGASVCNRRK